MFVWNLCSIPNITFFSCSTSFQHKIGNISFLALGKLLFEPQKVFTTKIFNGKSWCFYFTPNCIKDCFMYKFKLCLKNLFIKGSLNNNNNNSINNTHTLTKNKSRNKKQAVLYIKYIYFAIIILFTTAISYLIQIKTYNKNGNSAISEGSDKQQQ